MVNQIRIKANTLENKLVEAPYKWDFFQAVRRIECAHSDKPRIGESHHVKDDPIRFCQKPTLAFSSSSISAYQVSENNRRRSPRMFVNFLGLLGPNGPMPRFLTEYVLHRTLHYKDFTLARFLDIFNHRIISMFYRAWACHRPEVCLDRTDDNRLITFVGSLFGMGIKPVQHLDALPDVGKLRFAGHLVSLTRHADGLQAILNNYFKVPVTIKQMLGHWIEIPKQYHCRVGQSLETSQLGKTILVGERIWDCQQKFRISLGPLSLHEYQRMLPGSESLNRLIAWVRWYVGKELKWDLQLKLKPKEIPNTILDGSPRLGLTSWLQSQTTEKEEVGTVLLDPVSE